MTLEEHTATLDRLRQAENDADRANIALEIANDYKETLANVSELQTKIDALEKENATYSEVNSKLFLQLGSADKDSAVQGSTELDIPAKRSFEDLESKFD